MARGVAWALATRWSLRLIGLVNIVVLARILDPDDFGIWAMCGIVTGLISTFTNIGVQQLFIREPDSSRESCDTAWTIGILQSAFVALLILLCAPVAVIYFDEPRISSIFNILALTAVIGGFNNVGIMLARKELIFDLEFRLVTVTRISKVVVTVALAFTLKDYRAIVYGALFSVCIGTIYSYILHPYRPRIGFKFAKKYLQFGTVIIPQRLGAFLYRRLDTLVIGGVTGASTLGIYNLAAQLSEMAAFEIALPVSRGLYPSYSKLVENPSALVHAFLQGLSVTMAIVLPISGGLWALSNDIVYVIFGPKWSDAVWFLEWLAIFAAMECLCHFMSHQILIVTGHEKRAALFMWVKLAIFSILLFVGFQFSGIEGIAIARPIGAGVAVILSIALLVRSIPVTTSQILASLWRPLAAVVLMVLVLESLESLISIEQKLLSLFFHSVIGAITYLLGLFFFWMCVGRPPGLENFVFKLAQQRLSIKKTSD